MQAVFQYKRMRELQKRTLPGMGCEQSARNPETGKRLHPIVSALDVPMEGLICTGQEDAA